MSGMTYVRDYANVPIYGETTVSKPLNVANMSSFFTVSAGQFAYGNASSGGLNIKLSTFTATTRIVLTAATALTNVVLKGSYTMGTNSTFYNTLTVSAGGSTVLNKATGTATDTTIWSGTLSSGSNITITHTAGMLGSASGSAIDLYLTCDAQTVIEEGIIGYEQQLLPLNITEIHVAVEDGQTASIKEAYIMGDNEPLLIFGEIDPNAEENAIKASVTYTGDYTYQKLEENGVTTYLFTLTSAGTLTTTRETEVWMCGGGGGGGGNLYSADYAYGSGGGGGGGYMTTGTLPPGTGYIVTIGSGGTRGYGSNGNSTNKYGGSGSQTAIALSSGGTALAANGGGGGKDYNAGAGGSGGGAGWYIQTAYPSTTKMGTAGTGAGVDTTIFDKAHCAGGSGGRAATKFGGVGGSAGADGGSTEGTSFLDPTFGYVLGGEYGGGDGGRGSSANYSQHAGDATFYGGGGGGGGQLSDQKCYGYGGLGYQGVVYVMIRKI